jgi:predicted NBD/HSP70 family sugar kinase
MTEVSRVGRRLLEAGLARKRKLGRANRWEITTRGSDALQLRETTVPILQFKNRSVLRRFAQQVIEVASVRDQMLTAPRLMPAPGRVLTTLLAERAPMSSRELVAKTSLSRYVVNAAVSFLVGAGYVEEAPTNGHRKLKRPFRPDPTMRLHVNIDDYCALGVKILPTRVVGVVTDLRASVLLTRERPLQDLAPEAVIAEVVSVVNELRHPAPGLPKYMIGLGIELGGHVDCRGGTVVVSPNLGWRDPVQLGERVRALTGIETLIENDVNALAIHEQLVGSARDIEWFVAILLDEGIGGGLILDGQLMHGYSGLAGEIGHIVVEPNGRPCAWCRNRGCLETIASVRAICNAIGEATGELPTSIDEAAALADEGISAAVEAFREAGAAMGRAISIVQNFVNPRRILISAPKVLDLSSSSRAAELFDEAMREAAAAHVFSTAGSDCDVQLHHLSAGDVDGAQGAASTVLRRFIHRPLSWHPVLSVPSEDHDQDAEGALAVEFATFDAPITIEAGESNDPLGQLSEKMATIVTGSD